MELSQIELMFESEALEEAVVMPSEDANGWVLSFRSHQGEMLTLTDHCGAARVFDNLDTATQLAENIGFNTVRIEEDF